MPDEQIKLKEANKVEKPLPAYDAYTDKLQLPKALMGGTEAMRDHGKTYLPKEEKESKDAYDNRKSRSFLLEAYKRTIQKLTGEVFSKEVTLNDDMPEQIRTWCEEDIDLEGSDITRFSQKAFYYMLGEGCGGILVDYPSVKTKQVGSTVLYYEDYKDMPEGERKPAEWLPLTRAVEKNKGWRPYWVFVRADHVIGWRTTNINGKETLTQLRVLEFGQEDLGEFGVEEVERIRVLEPGKYTVWRKYLDSEKKVVWKIESEGKTSLDFIPYHQFMTGEPMSTMTAEPPLGGLADLNLAHWQSSSDQRNILHYARLITYFGKMLGGDEDDDITVGHNQIIVSNSEHSDFKVVEHSGKGIEAGRQDLQDLESQMAMFGLTYMMPRTGTVLATERAISKSENDSALRNWALSFQDFLNDCLKTTAKYISDDEDPEAGTVKVNTDFSSWLRDMNGQLLIDAYEAGAIPRQMVFEEFKRRGIVSDEYEFETVLEMIQSDGFEGAGGTGGLAAGFTGTAEEEFVS